VLLDNSILGKSILQSFYEEDDPTCKDCTGRQGSYGGFIITQSDNRKQIYRSHKFISWCEKYNLLTNRIPYEFAIGRAIHIPGNIDSRLFSSTEWSVVFK
jgi:hypothetical protein